MLAAHLAVLTILIFIGAIDWLRHEIWHAVTIPSIVLALVMASHLPSGFRGNAALGLVVSGGLMLTIWWLANMRYGEGSLGFGDVMLAALLGSIGGAVHGLLWLAVGIMLAGVYAAWRLYQGDTRATYFAYGTFLAMGGILGLLSTPLMQLIG